ncbi:MULTISPECIES: nucleoside triphosphate pyrophosphohydrolase family protein [Nocardia]|uniref:nucleoside triphosphate pyrophosphohydrolase family protein n=1 Tax=Nocardia TaxID=1817 RepID=UPI000D69B781|nr:MULTISPECIES: nucleoside triphosphate pyrophosphohydrolase family protein [Nocardia]
MTHDIWRSVREWQSAADVVQRDEPGWVAPADINLAIRLINEERNELATALRARDMIEVADGIADSLWVRAGLLLRLGLAREHIDLIVPAPGRPTWENLPPAGAETWIGELETTDRELRAAIRAGSPEAVDMLGHRGMYQLLSLTVLLQLPLDRIWHAVAVSNASKLVDGRVIRDEGGKIQKGPNFSPPDLASILAPPEAA